MSEFQNRIDAQRQVLALVNTSGFREELSGLSAKSIERWASANFVAKEDAVFRKLTEISGSLFFLATKSQEQITEDYSLLSRKVSALMNELRELMRDGVESR
jgi:hypothetical protein